MYKSTDMIRKQMASLQYVFYCVFLIPLVSYKNADNYHKNNPSCQFPGW